MNRVAIKPELLRWACERAGYSIVDLEPKFPQLPAWERGEEQPTLRQAENFARTTHTPIGYLFLSEPPVENMPIPDFRTMENRLVTRPSPDLLDTLYICQQRQDWYRDYARYAGETPLTFIGSASAEDDVVATAARIRGALGFNVNQRRQIPTWTDALRHFIEQAEALGVLVMCNGVVHNNNHRHLDPGEFRGFAMADPHAPLIFINGADTKAAQMFTLAHELAHLWLGQSAVSDAQPTLIPGQELERWCNRVAAEMLVPLAILAAEYRDSAGAAEEAARLARYFKVSTLVMLCRIHDAGKMTREELNGAYTQELRRLREIPRSSGGNFYLTQAARVSKRFAAALVASTLEGQTLYRDAFQMLGFSKIATFKELGRTLGVER
jgi:Zn-dependent peptidase ImmA (M78 family)